MEIENKIVLLSSKINPSEKELDELNGLLSEVEDWEAVAERLMQCSTAPLFYLKAPSLSNLKLMPDEEFQKIRKSYYYTLTRGTLMYQVLKKTMEVLKANGIDAIVLKGAYLAEALYKDVGLRLFSDIDLLVKEEQANRAFDLLLNAGFTQAKKADQMLEFLVKNMNYEHLPQLVYKGISIELHVRLHGVETKYKFFPQKMWENVEKTKLGGVTVYTPDLSDLLIHTILHLNKHFCAGEIQFTGFNDIVNILELWRDKLDWEEIIRRSIQYECEDIVFKFLVLVHRNYKAYVPDFIISEYIGYLDDEEQELFEKYLSGFKGEHFSVVGSVNRIKNLDSFPKKIRYVLWMIFPSKNYMIRFYQIKNPNLYLFYYPCRFWLGIKGLFRFAKLKIGKKK